MRRRTITMGMLIAGLLTSAPAAGQRPGDGVLAEYESVAGSVIRIRTIADLEYREPGESPERIARRHYTVDGTGVVVGETWVEGLLEYYVLTNHHVADASNYVLEKDGYLQVNPTNTLAVPNSPEESYLMKEESETIGANDIRLVEVVRLVKGDMALMRTVGANRDLPVFKGAIGFLEGELVEGAPIIASGYPFGGRRVSMSGTVAETNHRHELGLPHDDLVLSMPVQPGQSGGPIFLVEEDGETGAVEFRLIGLIHARDRERSYGVPYTLWEKALEEFPDGLRERLVR